MFVTLYFKIDFFFLIDFPQLPASPISDVNRDSPQSAAKTDSDKRETMADTMTEETKSRETPPTKRPKRSSKMPARYDT